MSIPTPASLSVDRPSRGARHRRALVAVLAVVAVAAGVGLLGRLPWASAATGISYDTGAGLTFVINSMTGDLTSLRHHGTELASGRAGQFGSGWKSATVTSTTFRDGSILVSAANPGIGVTQYYYARKNDNTIYLATSITKAVGEARFIARLNSAILSSSPVAANTGGTVSAVEGSDVFRFADGTTASKFYSSQRFIAQQPFGVSGNGHGVFLIGGTHELSSGGPFFRDIEVNDTGAIVNLTHYMYSGHEQTEPLRFGLHGPYAMAVTDGGPPAARSLDFLAGYLPGLLSDAQRGAVRGTAGGSWRGNLPGTVALAGPTGQYWAPVRSGTFLIGHVRPGTYTATLYAGELAVGATPPVTVTAGTTSTVALTGDVPPAGTLLQLGAFDGTPSGFRNADKIETMHPSDPRMSSWTGAVAAGAGAAALPMADFKAVNSPVAVTFALSAVPAGGARLRIATTESFSGARPSVSIGGWTAPNPPAPPKIDSRGVTRGTWRGLNTTYSYTIPASALRTGPNTLSISALSGNSGDGFLSPNFVFDAIALDPA